MRLYPMIIDDKELGCDICQRLGKKLIGVDAHEWYLCSHHAREIGVLW